jgi:hypothetical protein
VISLLTRRPCSQHNASLIVDDIEDGSLLRRGKTAAHIKYGIAWALNAANKAYFDAIEAANALEPARKPQYEQGTWNGAKQILLQCMVILHRGQGSEIVWRETGCVPNHDEFCLMAKQSTLTVCFSAWMDSPSFLFCPFDMVIRDWRVVQIVSGVDDVLLTRVGYRAR